MLKTMASAVLVASASAQCWRPHDFPNDIDLKKSKRFEHKRDYTS